MSVREDIMAMTCNPMESYDDSEFARYRIGFHHAKNKAVEIVEAWERELLAELADIKECHDNLLQSDKSVIQQMIAELRDLSELVHNGGLGNLGESECLMLVRRATIPYMDLTGDHAYHTLKVKAIIAKYEDKP